jgi:hypothetical protein
MSRKGKHAPCLQCSRQKLQDSSAVEMQGWLQTPQEQQHISGLSLSDDVMQATHFWYIP